MPHLSFVQFPSREEYSLEYCAQVGGKGVEPSRQCGKGCICKREWEGCVDQDRERGVRRWLNVLEQCGGESEATKEALPPP